jgi:M6 family metalloprotease-like protein
MPRIGLPTRQRRRRAWYVAGAFLAAAITATALPAQAQPSAVAVSSVDRPPIDPQKWVNQSDMTWNDYKPVPGTNWADPNRKASKRTFKGAVVLLDYPDEKFDITMPAKSTVFGNPGALAHDIPTDKVAPFFQDFLNKPETLNHGQTINGYWMEDSGGRFGVDLKAFGPYQLPNKSYQYGIDDEMNAGACPSDDTCGKDIRADGQQAWTDAVGDQVPKGFDFVFYVGAGQDESSTWQEFGPMMWDKPSDVPNSFGPPNSTGDNTAKTRYVPWTSWKAAAALWPNAENGTSIQAESSGMATYAHEFSHIQGIGDNYNNPFADPVRRAFTGPWSMMSRGAFNGPGGPHTRWQIPPVLGASLGSQHTVRDKQQLNEIDPAAVLQIDRDSLAKQGIVVAKVTAREVQRSGVLNGVKVTMTDNEQSCDISQDPLCDGGGYDNYSVEVVDRMGADSFQADHGVLLSKTKNQDSEAPFAWVVDAHPDDIKMVDYYKADGTPVMITRGDYRQLDDALFHAGTRSNTPDEYVDKDNKLRFSIIDIQRDKSGVLSYTVAISSLDGAGPQQRGVSIGKPTVKKDKDGAQVCWFPVTNTGHAATGLPAKLAPYLDSDVYQLSSSGQLDNALTTAKFGETTQVPVPLAGKASQSVTLTATSQGDPSKSASATCSQQ